MRPAKTRQILTAPLTWRAMSGGERFRETLTQQLQPMLGKMYGCHLLKLGALSAQINTEACAISHQVNVAPAGEGLQVQADLTQLPFASKSVDACLLAHTLAWSPDPHAVLREVDRILIDDGWLMLSGFHPASLLGLGKLLPWVRQRAPWNSRLFSQVRLIDWLHLLNYEVVWCSRFQVLPGNGRGGRLISTHLPALGCQQLLVARKRTFPLIKTPARRAAGQASIRTVVGAARHLRSKR
ncbi:class I SAM-dependent methyltransferase [Pantoea sp. 1.19]|uniref:class I SAM-dependent methyltransferase n=1 Tax=Pantoea sp. 1.19 TaxID=1925589 RepID=UPI000948DE3B|nr:class I SAM-dependent methyltransferase [Pantoea sp. 1.19]